MMRSLPCWVIEHVINLGLRFNLKHRELLSEHVGKTFCLGGQGWPMTLYFVLGEAQWFCVPHSDQVDTSLQITWSDTLRMVTAWLQGEHPILEQGIHIQGDLAWGVVLQDIFKTIRINVQICAFETWGEQPVHDAVIGAQNLWSWAQRAVKHLCEAAADYQQYEHFYESFEKIPDEK